MYEICVGIQSTRDKNKLEYINRCKPNLISRFFEIDFVRLSYT